MNQHIIKEFDKIKNFLFFTTSSNHSMKIEILYKLSTFKYIILKQNNNNKLILFGIMSNYKNKYLYLYICISLIR